MAIMMSRLDTGDLALLCKGSVNAPTPAYSVAKTKLNFIFNDSQFNNLSRIVKFFTRQMALSRMRSSRMKKVWHEAAEELTCGGRKCISL